MRDYIIVTDADSDLNYDYVQRENIPVFEMPFTFEGVEYMYDLNIHIPDYFKKLAEGSMVSTSARPYWEIKEFFKRYTDKGLDVLYIGLSNKLSAHFDNSCMAAKELMEEDKNARIELVDTLSISLGQGQLVIYARDLQKQGKSIDEVKAAVEEKKLNSAFFFMVDDLNHLKRGGRVTAPAAFFGGVLNLKPLMKANDEGQLVAAEKISGRKKAMAKMIELYGEKAIDPNSGTVFLCVADQEDGSYMKNALSEKYPGAEYVCCQVGPVIGGHTGQGVIGVVFFGKTR